MVDKDKILSDILNNKLGEDIDNHTIQELADHIKQCKDCKVDIDTIRQTIKLVRTGDFEVLLPPSVSKRLFKVLDLDED
ncbi:MAG: hypothetical protein V3W20_00800 [Candidatus Neomarinimicrobiota bacterium]